MLLICTYFLGVQNDTDVGIKNETLVVLVDISPNLPTNSSSSSSSISSNRSSSSSSSSNSWYLLELTGNYSSLLAAPAEFSTDVHRQLAALLDLQPGQLTVNRVSYTPSLLVNVTSDLQLDLPANTSLHFRGERLEVDI